MITTTDYIKVINGLTEFLNQQEAELETLRALAASRAGDYATLLAALEEIKANYGQVCNEFDTCQHPACQASYSAWACADEALRRTSTTGE